MSNSPSHAEPSVWQALRPADIGLWLFAVAALVALFMTLWRPAADAAEVVIMVDNQTQQTLSLSTNQLVTVAGPLGNSVISVQGGRLRFVSSPCRNQVCVHSGWASHSGELLACLPNRIALVLKGQADESAAVDAVNF